ncbi:oligopeptide transporter [Wilcoxina mikolae CBS 423.85]|nr:oligopeptide transporter [Wilcoxina mikolae CBS 423.85]
MIIVPSEDEEFQRRDATEEEIRSLRHTVDDIPSTVWIVAFAGAAERFTYYAVTAPWQNYMQNGMDDKALPGALGLGQSTATNIYNAFFFFSYLVPLPFAIISDTWLGRYRTLSISLAFYMAGCLVMFATSLPTSLRHGAGVGGLASAMILIGLGVGGVKATFPPFLGDQYTHTKPQVLKRNDGEFVIADRTLTIQYIYNVFYWFTNIAALSSIAATWLEKEYGFWAAYLLPACFLWIAVILLLVQANKLVKAPPQGNILPMAARTLICAARSKFRLDAAKPVYQLEHFSRTVPWDENFIAEMKRGLIACRVISSFVLFYLCFNQIYNNLVSQAGQMQLNGVPNDTIQALNGIGCIVLGPVFQKLLYPLLNKHKISFGPIGRITVAFVTMAAAMAYAAGVQRLIYNTGPCYEKPLACPASDSGRIPNSVSVWIQTPVYFILAAAEILGFVTASEYAYSKAPKNMKALVQALTQVTAGVGAALGMSISPVVEDPRLVIMYTALAASMLVVTAPFWWLFKKYDKIDEDLNALNLTIEEGKTDTA